VKVYAVPARTASLADIKAIYDEITGVSNVDGSEARTRPRRVIERRVTPGEVEIRQHGKKIVMEGHAIRWDKFSQDLGGFVESSKRGATRKTIREADIRALVNHDPNMVLGRNKASTLDLAEDDSGLYYRIYPPGTSYANDLMISMERQDVNNSSFGFRMVSEDWGLTDDNYPHRTLTEMALQDISIVTFPAYLDAESKLSDSNREAALAGLARRSGHDIDELLDPSELLAVVKLLPSVGPARGPVEATRDKATRKAWAQQQLAQAAAQDAEWTNRFAA
jgi:uncharacterized protein